MKKLLYIFFALFVGVQVHAQEDFRQNPPQPGPAPKIEMGDYETFQLANGLQGIVVTNRKLPRVNFQIFLDIPPMVEGEKAGLSQITGQLLSSGTANRTKAELDEAIDFIGASLNTGGTGMFGSSLTKHQDALLELMADVLYNPAFPEAEFEKIKQQLLSFLVASKTNPDAIAGNINSVMRYGKTHPYGEVLTEATVKNVTLEDCKAYYRKVFKPNMAYFIAVGDIDLNTAKAVAESYFGKWEKGETLAADYPQPQPPAQTQVDFVDNPGAVQSVVNITYPIDLKPGHPDAITVGLMNNILGGGGGRLYLNIREDKGYTYGAYSSFNTDPVVGNFNAGGNVRNEVTDSAIVEFLYEMDRIRDERVTEDELNTAKARLTGSFSRGLESPQTIASYALNTVRYDLPADYYAKYLQRLNEVTSADIQRVAKKYILPAQAHITVVGVKDGVAEKLARFAASGKVNFYDIYGNPVETKAVGGDMTPGKVIDNYLEAIGGTEKLASIEDVTTKMATSVQGMSLQMTNFQKAPNKMAMQVNMNGSLVNEVRFDGEKAMVSQMGQKQVLEGEQAEGQAAQAELFPERNYAANGYQMELMGIEQVNGSDCYKVNITFSNGSLVSEFYDVATGLKLKSVQVQELPGGQTLTVSNEYGDYREVQGVKFPFKITTSGAMPIPLEMTVESIEVNTGLAEDLFQINP